jgi:hypothetical protein
MAHVGMDFIVRSPKSRYPTCGMLLVLMRSNGYSFIQIIQAAIDIFAAGGDGIRDTQSHWITKLENATLIWNCEHLKIDAEWWHFKLAIRPATSLMRSSGQYFGCLSFPRGEWYSGRLWSSPVLQNPIHSVRADWLSRERIGSVNARFEPQSAPCIKTRLQPIKIETKFIGLSPVKCLLDEVRWISHSCIHQNWDQSHQIVPTEKVNWLERRIW